VLAAIEHEQLIQFSFDMTDAQGGPVCGSLNLLGTLAQLDSD
jgi:hypothetical protein